MKHVRSGYMKKHNPVKLIEIETRSMQRGWRYAYLVNLAVCVGTSLCINDLDRTQCLNLD